MLKKMYEKAEERYKRIPIAKRITILYSGVFALFILLTSTFTMGNAFFAYRRISQKEMDEALNEVTAYIKNGQKVSKETIDHFSPDKSINIRVLVLNEQHTEAIYAQRTFPAMPLRRALADKKEIPRDFMFEERHVSYNGNVYVIQMARKFNRENLVMRNMMILYLIANAAGIFISFLIGNYISKVMLRPIEKIRLAADRISIEDLSRRIDVEGPDDELKELAITFNEMIGRLEQSFQKQNQFITDASHELRTPISVIQGYANLISRWGKEDKEILTEAIDSIKAETDHMSKLIKTLLFLAKDDQNKNALHMQAVSLNTVAQDIIKDAGVMDMAGRIQLEEEGEAVIYGDFDLLKQLIWIFIDNSIKYARANDNTVYIKIYHSHEMAYVSVKDNGIGVSKEDIPFLFDRFFRADKSRSKEIPGTGLGLSIAQWIIKMHHAKVNIISEKNKGMQIIVGFPIRGGVK